MDEAISNDTFQWPEQPSQDWWQLTGTGLGLDDGQVRFAAALWRLGGIDAKKNTEAARLAGLDLNRTEAFRTARSVSVKRLLDEADKVRAGKQPALTEGQIEQIIDDGIRRPDALTVARFLELREKRLARLAVQKTDEPEDPTRTLHLLIKSTPESGVGAALAAGAFFVANGNIVNMPAIKEIAPLLKTRFSEEWFRWRSAHPDPWKVFLDECAAGPLLTGEELLVAVAAKITPWKPNEGANAGQDQ